MSGRLMAVVIGAMAPALLGAQDEGFYGRLRSVEPGVAVQRADEAETEEATTNLPFLPGDRLWTDHTGEAELQFGALLAKVEPRSKLDFEEDSPTGAAIPLRLWSGSVVVLSRHAGERTDLVVLTPAGTVEPRRGGAFRVEVRGGETRLAVYEGEAAIEAGLWVTVRAGQETTARRGEWAEAPRRADPGEMEDIGRWAGAAYAWGSREEYLPDELAPYASELDGAGSWAYEAEVGNVWRPDVGPDWSPYQDGRWVWTTHGWTWVPYESWGWATSHYGRWDYSLSFGWYWVPGRSWGPAWVSWAIGPDYVGWCPLGHRDRPVVIHQRARHHRGHAVPRYGLTAWRYSKRGDLGARDIRRRHVDPRPDVVRHVRVIESPHQRPRRDLSLGSVETPRPPHARTRPRPGDTIPELRPDPSAHPGSVGRVRPGPRPESPDRGDQRRDGGAAATRPRAVPRDGVVGRPVGQERLEGTRPRVERSDTDRERTLAGLRARAEAERRLREQRSEGLRSEREAAEARQRALEAARERSERQRVEREREGSRRQEVVDRLFRPLSERRSAPREEGSRSVHRPRDGSSSRERSGASVTPRTEQRPRESGRRSSSDGDSARRRAPREKRD